MFKKIKFVLRTSLRFSRIYALLTKPCLESNRLLGEIVRNTHSIEKGLSLENVRMGFGYSKIMDAAKMISRYEQIEGVNKAEQIMMFVDALADYIKYHSSQGYSSPQFRMISDVYDNLIKKYPPQGVKFGGVIKVNRPVYKDTDIAVLERIILERHSVREFKKTPVSDEKLKKAIDLACHCPSACNRQCYRVHIIDKKHFEILSGWLDGVGGFADELDKMLIITGRMSDYRPSEQMQYIVSASVFAAYLTITLQVYEIGCCFIQRPLFPTKKFFNITNKLNIPEDEQSVCVLGIGSLKDSYMVPVSHRLKYDKIVKIF